MPQPNRAVDSDPLTGLAKLALGRDPEQTRLFLEAIVPSLRSICRNALGEGNIDLEDAVQECLVAVHRALPKFRFESPVIHYVNRIALRVAIAARKRRRSREDGQHAFVTQSALLDDSSPTPETWSLLVRLIVDELSSVQAEAIILRMVLGYSFEEMGRHLDISASTAKSRLRLAKDSLRDVLDGRRSRPRNPR